MIQDVNDKHRRGGDDRRAVITQEESRIHFLDYWRVVRIRFPIVLLGFLLCAITAGIFTYFSHQLYQANVLIEVEQGGQEIFIFEDSNGEESFRADPRFSTTQFQILQRKEMLYPVIDKLGLVERWKLGGIPNSRDAAYARLRQMLHVHEVRNTNLIQITVESPDRIEAAELANFIADSYQNFRIDMHNKTLGAALSALEEEVSKQRARVEAAGAAMAKMRSELGISDLNPDSSEDPRQAYEEILLEHETAVAEKENELGTLQAMSAELDSLSGGQLINALPTLKIEDQTVQSILPELQNLEAEIALQSNSGLGSNHPLIRSLVAKKEAYSQQLESQALSIRKAVKTSLEIAEKSLTSMRKELEALKEDAGSAKTRAAEYGRTKQEYIQAKKLLEEAELRLSSESMQRSMPLNPARIWERAEPPMRPHKPNIFLNMVLGVVSGIILGVGLAFFLEYLDTSVKTVEELETQLNLPVLATIPCRAELIVERREESLTEAYRMLKTNIEFNQRNVGRGTFTFTSGAPGEGKSTTIANLAFVFSQGGYNTLVVDADLRRPVQHKLWNLNPDKGLSDYLQSSLEHGECIQKTHFPNLHVLCSGRLPKDAPGILNSQRMMELIDEIRKRYDIVLFDAPPILGLSDAGILSRIADHTVIVVQHRRFPGSLLKRVKQAIESAGGSILGVVLNNADLRFDEYSAMRSEYYARYSAAVISDTKGRVFGRKSNTEDEY